MYLPVQYPKWVSGVLVESEAEERELLGDAFVPVSAATLAGLTDSGLPPVEYPKWVEGQLVHSLAEEHALLDIVTAPSEAPVAPGDE